MFQVSNRQQWPLVNGNYCDVNVFEKLLFQTEKRRLRKVSTSKSFVFGDQRRRISVDSFSNENGLVRVGRT